MLSKTARRGRFLFPELLTKQNNAGIMSLSWIRGAACVIIERVELFEIRLPLIHYFETSFGRTVERRIILIRVIDKEGAEG